MFKTRPDGSILYAPNGWWSKESYVLPNTRLKNRIRYINLIIGFFLAILFLVAFFSAEVLWVFAALLFVVLVTIWQKRLERKWLIDCEVVDERISIFDVYRERWFVPETRRWMRIWNTITPLFSVVCVLYYLYGVNFGWDDEMALSLRQSFLSEILTLFSFFYIIIMLAFVVFFYRESTATKAIRKLIMLLIVLSILMYGFVVVAMMVIANQ